MESINMYAATFKNKKTTRSSASANSVGQKKSPQNSRQGFPSFHKTISANTIQKEILNENTEANDKPIKGFPSPVSTQLKDSVPKDNKAVQRQQNGNNLVDTAHGRHIDHSPKKDFLRLNTDTIQRQIENENYNDTTTENVTAAKKFFSDYDIAVQNAYNFAISVPSLNAYAGLNGYTKLWIEKWKEFLGGGKPKLMAATFGYVVESLVSDSNTEFYPAPPSGYTVDTQVSCGGTRPDLALRLTNGSSYIAWLDLTASESADHIFSKDDWASKVKIFAEVTYPSLTPGILAFMKQNKDNTGGISKEDFELRVKEAEKQYLLRKAQWQKLGESFYYSKLSSEIPAKKELQLLDPSIPREFMRQKLQNYFEPEEFLVEKMVPSILAALGVNSSSWGYTTGYSISERAGEAWLVDNDPSLGDL